MLFIDRTLISHRKAGGEEVNGVVSPPIREPGQAVVKKGGTRPPIGDAHWRSPATGNIDNPHASRYIRNR